VGSKAGAFPPLSALLAALEGPPALARVALTAFEAGDAKLHLILVWWISGEWVSEAGC